VNVRPRVASLRRRPAAKIERRGRGRTGSEVGRLRLSLPSGFDIHDQLGRSRRKVIGKRESERELMILGDQDVQPMRCHAVSMIARLPRPPILIAYAPSSAIWLSIPSHSPISPSTWVESFFCSSSSFFTLSREGAIEEGGVAEQLVDLVDSRLGLLDRRRHLVAALGEVLLRRWRSRSSRLAPFPFAFSFFCWARCWRRTASPSRWSSPRRSRYSS